MRQTYAQDHGVVRGKHLDPRAALSRGVNSGNKRGCFWLSNRGGQGRVVILLDAICENSFSKI
jgi:hypothetical protein